MGDDDNKVHETQGAHGARLNSLETGHKSLDDRITKVDDRQRSDVRKGLIAAIGILISLVTGVFKWLGAQLGSLFGQ